MKHLTVFAAALLVAATTSAAPARADENSDQEAAIAAALLIFGAAALAHHENHHENGKYPSDPNKIADFERGYRDGLHNAEYDHRHYSPEYNEGFAAGHKERHNRLAHRHATEEGGPNAPTLAMRACVGQASAEWGRDPRDIHVVKSRQAGADDFYVEVAAGHRHGNCEVNSTGRIYLFRKGHI
jgi:hypothetical protein